MSIILNDNKIVECSQNRITEYMPSKSGFNGNRVFLSDGAVIKVFEKSDYKYYENEILVLKSLRDSGKVAKIIETGVIDDKKYIKVERIEAEALYGVWHLLNRKDRENIIRQIAGILREINAIPIGGMNFKAYIESEFNERYGRLIVSKELKDKIYNFFVRNIGKIEEDEDVYLIYLDGHFDNFMYNKDDGKVYVIDFEDVKVGALDYQLDMMNRMSKYPQLFASEDDEKNIRQEDYQDLLSMLKRYYPKMFENKNLKKRLQLYSLVYDMQIIIKHSLHESEIADRLKEDLEE